MILVSIFDLIQYFVYPKHGYVLRVSLPNAV